MSDKDRRKKDGQNKDKKNQRMREDIDERAQKDLSIRAEHKHEAKMTDTVSTEGRRPEASYQQREETESCGCKMICYGRLSLKPDVFEFRV